MERFGHRKGDAAALCVAVLLLCLPATAAGQRIEGRITDGSGAGLAEVAVTVVGEDGVFTLSGRRGDFVLDDMEAGPVELSFSRIGYSVMTATVTVDPDATTRIGVQLTAEAIELDAIDVSVRSNPSLYLEGNGFYRRSERGFGLQFSRDRLDELHMLEVADAMRNISGIRLQRDPYMLHRVYAMSPRMRRFSGESCALTVYVDGVKTLDPNLNQVEPDWLVAMEVYLGADAPAKYRTTMSCGVVLLWTRRM